MKAFTRRAVGLALTVVSALGFGTGCESWLLRRPPHSTDPGVTRTSGEDSKDEVETDKILDVQSDPSKPKRFFSASRLPAGLSDESREIERHLGVQ
jgi:hypothetical protein